MRVSSYRELIVWQRAMDLVCASYEVCARLPHSERYGLGDQIRRAAVSVPANIAEGHSRAHRKEFLQFLSIARGSQKELEALLTIVERLAFVPPERLRRALALSEQVSKMLVSMREKLQATAPPARRALHAQQTARKYSSQSRTP